MRDNLKRYRMIFREAEELEDCPLFLLRGREEFIMNQLAEKIISSRVDRELRSFNLGVEYAGQVDLGSFISDADSYPFMAGRKVLVLKELEKLKGSCAKLTDYCLNPAGTSVVIMIHNTHNQLGRRNRQPSGYRKLQDAVAANGKVYEFKKLTEAETVSWIKGKCSKLNIDISNEAARSMVRSIGDNLYDIMNEIQKLGIVYQGESVGAGDVENIIGSYRMNAVFDLTDSLTPGGEKRSLSVLIGILSSGAESTSVILYNLIRHFLDLMKIKEGYRAGGYWYRKLKRQADSYRKRDILLWLENLRAADLDIKSSLLPDEMIIMNCFMNSINGRLYGEAERHFLLRVG
ncbi:MAG: DNA polymerase III subunit delta [Candidatus Latescibacteria bacterium]|nr:DNA polymerase III subunit delta [bacterium]MBD3425381.1 DNA polymerase III subunit delta [Candidatus Latescibacterota bacterium]